MNARKMLRLGIMSGGLAVGLAAEAVPARAGTESIIHTFKRDHAARDGIYPITPLIKVGSQLYGATQSAVFAVGTKGKFHVVRLFNEGSPYPLLNVGGLLYGTTAGGGASGCGTVYTLTLQGTENVIYTFQGGTDGCSPMAAMLDVDGTLYGTTLSGGDGVGSGGGTAFKLTLQGAETVLHRFGTTAHDGPGPLGLIYAGGVFYGTTYSGTVFRLSKSGSEKIITQLSHSTDSDPVDIGGVLYGIEYGTRYADAFALTLQGVKTILHTFKGGSDGETPMGNLTNVGGTIYGTTYYGGHPGCGDGCGTVYSLTPQGQYTLIYAFNGTPDGANPMAGVLDVDGTLYGTTYLGGDPHCFRHQGCGTIYAITP